MGRLNNMIAECPTFDVLVIGSGPAGQNAALEASEHGANVLMIEQEPQVGGACVQFGTIPSKTLRETALTLAAFQRRSGDVYQITRNSELSVASLMKRLNEVVHAHQETTRKCLQQAGIHRAYGRAKLLSPHEVEVTKVSGEQTTVWASTIIIATGSRPRNPPNIRVDHENILDSDSILSMSYLPRSIVIFGGGVIACEYASTFSALGVQVTMIDKASRPLGFIDSELVEFFLRQLRLNGGEFVGNCELASVKWDGVSSVKSVLADGRTFHADKAFVALGRLANIDSLGLQNAGLQASDKGLLAVNEFCQTVVPNIYAVGDTIGPPALASASMDQGRRAAIHALTEVRSQTSLSLPTGIYTIPEIATVGMTEYEAREKFSTPRIAKVSFDQIARAQITANPTGMLKMVTCPNGHRLLGIQVVGDGATELVHVGQMALIANLPVDTFIQTTFNFPTMAEAYRLAALEIVHTREAASIEGQRRPKFGYGIPSPFQSAIPVHKE
jgi:NAD(P) transhydrogenase